MATLAPGFEDQLRSAIAEDIQAKTVDESNNLAFRFIQRIHENLRTYGRRYGIDVSSVIDSIRVESVERTRNGVRVRIEGDHPLGIFEYGADPHTIRATNAEVLSFVWADPPQWVREEFDQARDPSGRFASGWRVFFKEVDHPGVPESRAIRDALQWLAQEVE